MDKLLCTENKCRSIYSCTERVYSAADMVTSNAMYGYVFPSTVPGIDGHIEDPSGKDAVDGSCG